MGSVPQEEAAFDIIGGNGHAIGGLVTGAAGAAVGAEALEEGTGEVDSAVLRTVRLRGAGAIEEEDAIGNERSWKKRGAVTAGADGQEQSDEADACGDEDPGRGLGGDQAW